MAYTVRGDNRKKIRCVETGEVWESKKCCAAALGVSPAMLYEHVRFGEKVKGLTFVNV